MQELIGQSSNFFADVRLSCRRSGSRPPSRPQLIDAGPNRLIVRAALRLPQAPLRQQFALIAPHLAGLDLLVFDQSGLGEAAAELLPKTPPRFGVCLGGDRPPARSAQGDRLVLGKSWLVQRLGMAMRGGELTVADRAPGRELLRRELAQFVFKPGAQGRLRLEADLVIAAALAVLASQTSAVTALLCTLARRAS